MEHFGSPVMRPAARVEYCERQNACCDSLLGGGAAALGNAAAAGAERSVGRFLRSRALVGRAGLAAHGARAGRAACAFRGAVERVVLLARELAVVVLVELGEARVELGCVLRLVARDEAVVVLVEAFEPHAVA